MFFTGIRMVFLAENTQISDLAELFSLESLFADMVLNLFMWVSFSLSCIPYQSFIDLFPSSRLLYLSAAVALSPQQLIFYPSVYASFLLLTYGFTYKHTSLSLHLCP